MNPSEGQFSWVKAQDEDGSRVEHADTPAGKYVVNKGRGKLKWAASHPTSGWEVLGTTRGEVRAEAEAHHKDYLEEAAKPKKTLPPSEDSI